MPPLGALHLAATARRRGHSPSFLDLALLLRRGDLPDDDGLIDACAQAIVAAEPQVLGLGARVNRLIQEASNVIYNIGIYRIYREFFGVCPELDFFDIFRPDLGSNRPGRALKGFL